MRQFIADLPSGNVEMVEISDENGNATQMTKAEYDRQQAEQSTPSLTDEAATK
jgi:hypothetical protein